MKQNKLSQYFLYASGEILLVVAGILIALYINNANVESQQETKVNSLLETVLNDLTSDIENANKVLVSLEIQDSIASRIMKGEMTRTSYDTMGNLFNILTYNYFDTRDHGFNTLSLSIDEIPLRYGKVYEALAKLNSESKLDLNTKFNFVQELIMGLERKLSNTQPWYSQLMANASEGVYEAIPEMVDYLLNDPYYKNDAASLWILILNNSSALKGYRHQAIECYTAIHQLMKPGVDLPALITDYMIVLPPDTLKKYAGIYSAQEIPGFKAQITLENGNLGWSQMSQTEEEPIAIYPKSALEFFSTDGSLTLVFNQDIDGNFLSYKLTSGGQEYTFIRDQEN